jgi:beta-glucosidase
MNMAYPYQDQSLPFSERARDLVARMTLAEKFSQMTYQAKAIPRLGVPSYNWWNEALHGVARAGVATVFPQAIGMAATFDETLIREIAAVIGTEGRAKFHEAQRKGDHDIYKGLTFWSPNINIFRDPRWGRGQETYGEDPYLTGRLGVAFVKGLQGADPKYLQAAACAKHFAVHSGPESLRHEFNAVVSQKDLWETYLPAFEALVREAGVEAVMGAYNRTNGEPCNGSKTLLQDILRDEWGFAGHVTSDCWAIKDFHEGHHVTATAVDSVALALKSGCDVNCGNMYLNLQLAFDEGLIDEATVDRAVTRLMMTRMKLGLFDRPEDVPHAATPYELNDSAAHRAKALDAAKASLVLLKNEGDLLPLRREAVRSIAVIGPNADSRAALIGNYFGTASRYVTVLEGIQDAVGEATRVFYAKGCHLYKDRDEFLAEAGDRIGEAVAAAERADVAIVCLGLDATIEGEEGDTSNEYTSGDKNDIELPGQQLQLLQAVQATGKPVVLVLLSGSALAVNWADEHVPAIIQAWYPGAQGGKAIASLLFGDFSPSGRLPLTFYRSAADLPAFTDYAMAGRTYRYLTAEPLYPFGFGLGYTHFAYGPVRLAASSIQAGEPAVCQVTVKNDGRRAGRETVQLYLQDLEADVVVPHWQLAGIRKIDLQPGEERDVSLTITPRQMALINEAGQAVLEPGLFRIHIGGSQPDARSVALTGQTPQSAILTVNGNPLPLRR